MIAGFLAIASLALAFLLGWAQAGPTKQDSSVLEFIRGHHEDSGSCAGSYTDPVNRIEDKSKGQEKRVI